MPEWLARPVLHVTDVEASLGFYVDRLGFTSPWRYEEDGRVRVAQVDRQGCALIQADMWPEKSERRCRSFLLTSSRGRQMPRRCTRYVRNSRPKGVLVKDGSGVDDPDGNQLFFNYPRETTSGTIAKD